jgi:transposase InsO family protein
MMSWKESDRVSQRLEFVRLAVVRGANVSALCERFGVSRKTGYKWIDRWKSDGLEGLKDKCRRPLVSPGRTGDDVEQIIIKLRTKHPQWGGRTLRKRLQVLGHTDVPSASSITRILHRHGLISRDATEKHQAWDRFERTEPNDLWQIDYKGDFLLANDTRCYPLTLLDDHSRYSLGIIACDNQRQATAKEHFRGVFTRYGIPRAIYVDNGNPWGTSGSRTRHSRLSAWLMRQDIEVIHGRPYHPQGRGKIERFHRTLNQEVLQDRELSNLVEAQGVFDPWRDVYNLERPHQGLNLEVPASRYRISEREFRDVDGPFQYSDRFAVRKLHQRTGQFQFQGKVYRVSEAFLDQPIGLCPTEIDGIWDIYYCRYRIGQLDQPGERIEYDRRLVESRCARSNQATASGGSVSKD